jgi:hypothetical protein
MTDFFHNTPATAASIPGTTDLSKEMVRVIRTERNRMPAVGNGKERIRVCP